MTTAGSARWRIAAAVVAVVALVIGIAVFLILRSVPDYRTAFLVDTSTPRSGGSFGPVADAVGSAAQNAGDDDALSLRRFGGTCGDPKNTAELVGSGRKNGQKVGTAAHALTASGRSTLESGVLAAIGDFSGRYPFRGHRLNRIVVVTSHGADACASDQAAVQKRIREKAAKSGVKLDFRFVGYKVPAKERQPLTALASAGGAPRPQFTRTPTELTATLKKLTVPESPEGKPITVPATRSPTTTPAPLADGKHTVYIRRVDAKARTLTVDPFDELWGEAARKAKIADGLRSDLSNDYYDRNPDKKTVTVHVAPGAGIGVNQILGDAGIGGSPEKVVTVSLSRLSSLVAGQDFPDSYSFELTMTNGQVAKLRELWHP
ncbi:hypothetical protein [Actinomadura rayongensis]|uniref:VWA domain-containing protein n=1 Tax=Actinomadura rayongensis TaxID=1429076 RepID=A0A6I4W2X9_9ACTN|nr:hypothetical protein [Actinomadura rayongensis]MXQ64537.1 hypothetical protein [Actinomadura rayongensis]